MSRQRKALYLFLGLAVVVGLLAAKMVAQVHRGEELFWLAELWAPAAALSIGLVTGIEFLMPPAGSKAAKAEGLKAELMAPAMEERAEPLPEAVPVTSAPAKAPPKKRAAVAKPKPAPVLTKVKKAPIPAAKPKKTA